MQLSEIAFDSTKKGFKTTKRLLRAIELFKTIISEIIHSICQHKLVNILTKNNTVCNW